MKVHSLATSSDALKHDGLSSILKAIGGKCHAIVTSPSGVVVRDTDGVETGFTMTMFANEDISALLKGVEVVLLKENLPCIIDWEVKNIEVSNEGVSNGD